MMSTDDQLLLWLYRDQLQVEDHWAIKHPNGFSWWAHEYRQDIASVAQILDGEGEMAYLMSISTDVVADIPENANLESVLGDLASDQADLAGFVYDVKERTVRLHSLMRVHDGIRPWAQRLLSVAAVSQLHQAEQLAETLALATGGKPAKSRHPIRGVRNETYRDDMAELASCLFPQHGAEPSRWDKDSFEQACFYAEEMRMGEAEITDAGLRLEFNTSGLVSSFLANPQFRHQEYGNGLLLSQKIPYEFSTQEKGLRLCMALNALHLAEYPAGYGLGTYAFRDGAIFFQSFVPNMGFIRGDLVNFVLSAGERHETLAELLV